MSFIRYVSICFLIFLTIKNEFFTATKYKIWKLLPFAIASIVYREHHNLSFLKPVLHLRWTPDSNADRLSDFSLWIQAWIKVEWTQLAFRHFAVWQYFTKSLGLGWCSQKLSSHENLGLCKYELVLSHAKNMCGNNWPFGSLNAILTISWLHWWNRMLQYVQQVYNGAFWVNLY